LRIDRLSAGSRRLGGRASLDALHYVDNLKALHAIAQTKFEALRAAAQADRSRLEAETEAAFRELDAAFRTPMPPFHGKAGPA
jgi:hypothetical protein